ncbi:ABC transporter permease [Burkholderia multivorans]|uniref:ABC transporter permease n=1 Tax=Burkholderia multivorans TaxID=87883 RepID=UPI001C2192D0|nr:ABC transporter permease [Burkholderia multivorans]MBU9185756.1 ABC transporter permease [Burkholderia multivorans]MBU9284090.1 ABC transporter permease [Burkholderia multivorans]MBU9420754.1 ABC transporter permease [Burkholderia multivorans]MDN7451280.1 ABC transporter permease [Burkholderia multivorans]
MLGFVIRKIASVIPTLIVVTLLVFTLLRVLPGDPAQQMLGDQATPQALAALRVQYGLDKPWPVQYLTWAGRALHGDLGHSLLNQESVSHLIWERFQLSLSIVFVAVLFATAIAVPFGMLAARNRSRWPDLAVVAIATVLLSIPSFWLGVLLLLWFGLHLKWLPIVGYVSLHVDPWKSVQFLILPIVTLTAIQVGALVRMMRSSAIDVLGLEYIMHARATGLSESRVMLRHCLPNAFAPTWTLIGLSLGHLLGGIAVIETVFTLPGLGRLLVDSIFARDYPVIQGCLLFTATFYVFVNLFVDLFYPLFDPKVSA